jgi:RNA polymerase sigma factor (sigma-70 family)
MEEPDERLVDLARDGDERAFAAIVARYRVPLLHYCRRILPPAGADDALQQTFINAYAALTSEGATPPQALRPWLYRIAHNAALNMARDPQLGLAPVPETLGGSERLEEVVQQREHLDRVLRVVQALPDAQREVIVRHELGGDSHERIATDLGLSAGAVRQLAYRARAAIRAGAAILIPGPVLRAVPWLSGGSGVAEGSGAVLAKTAVVLVVAGAAGGGAVESMSGREGDRARPQARAPAETAPTKRQREAPPAVRRPSRPAADPIARPRAERRPAAVRIDPTPRAGGEAPAADPVDTRPQPDPAPEPADDDITPLREDGSSSGPGSGGDSSGPGSGSIESTSDSSGPGSASIESTSESSGPGSRSSGSSTSGSSGSGTSGSGSSGSSSGSSGSGSGSDSSGPGSGPEPAEIPELVDDEVPVPSD